jgi:diguanylate cyclase (GGDEF)-like protein
MAMLLGMLSLVLMRSAREANRVMMENIDMTHSLQYRATHDSLVGLLNREEFENIFKIQTEGTQVTCALLFIDLDNFKAVNDTLGHQAGDKALQRIGEIIRAAVRAEDTAAGIGKPSEALAAMEMGFDAVLLNTACARAGQPELMAQAFKQAVEAGRLSYTAGPMVGQNKAQASTAA